MCRWLGRKLYITGNDLCKYKICRKFFWGWVLRTSHGKLHNFFFFKPCLVVFCWSTDQSVVLVVRKIRFWLVWDSGAGEDEVIILLVTSLYQLHSYINRKKDTNFSPKNLKAKGLSHKPLSLEATGKTKNI